MAKFVIHHAAIEVHFAGVFGLEIAALEVDYHITAQFQMVEQQVDVKILLADIKMILSSNEGKALPELQQKFFQMGDKTSFQFAFVKTWLQGQEVEEIGVFQRLLHQIGVGWGQAAGKVAGGSPLPEVSPGFYLHHEDVSAPAVLDGGLHVPAAGGQILDLGDQFGVMPPGDSP